MTMPRASRIRNWIWNAATALVLAQPITTVSAASLAEQLGLATPEPFEVGLDEVMARVQRHAEITKEVALAVNITPEGHYEFKSSTGATYTAGTPTELARAPSVLLPTASNSFSKADAFLTTRSLFAGQVALKPLPHFKMLRVSVGSSDYLVERRPGLTLALRVGQFLALIPGDMRELREGLAQLDRPISTRQIDVLSAYDTIATTPPAALPAKTSRPPAAPGIPVIGADIDRLTDAFAERGQRMVILSAKIERATAPLASSTDGTTIESAAIEPPSGRTRSLPLAPLAAAAFASDTDLVILNSTPPRQPGSPTWLYRSTDIANADRAATASQLKLFLEPFAESRGGFDVRVSFDPSGSVRLDASQKQNEDDWTRLFAPRSGVAADVAFEIAGVLKPDAIRAYFVSSQRRAELRQRLLPGVHSAVQWTYLVLLIVGLLGWRQASVWWRRLWPLERPTDYASLTGWYIARSARFAVFTAIFLPLAGPLAAATGLFRRRSTAT
ncbi:MAG: hypothetical protein K2Y05_11635 [Hyphomicrobiaceae bacterium]|nr:hypothetical protein [Hyphomicrobiaceae bacterium]